MFNLWIFTYFCVVVLTQGSSAWENVSRELDLKIDSKYECGNTYDVEYTHSTRIYFKGGWNGTQSCEIRFKLTHKSEYCIIPVSFNIDCDTVIEYWEPFVENMNGSILTCDQNRAQRYEEYCTLMTSFTNTFVIEFKTVGNDVQFKSFEYAHFRIFIIRKKAEDLVIDSNNKCGISYPIEYSGIAKLDFRGGWNGTQSCEIMFENINLSLYHLCILPLYLNIDCSTVIEFKENRVASNITDGMLSCDQNKSKSYEQYCVVLTPSFFIEFKKTGDDVEFNNFEHARFVIYVHGGAGNDLVIDSGNDCGKTHNMDYVPVGDIYFYEGWNSTQSCEIIFENTNQYAYELCVIPVSLDIDCSTIITYQEHSVASNINGSTLTCDQNRTQNFEEYCTSDRNNFVIVFEMLGDDVEFKSFESAHLRIFKITDETNETIVNCEIYEFQCVDGSICVPIPLLCDDFPDCPDSSDEDQLACHSSTSTAGGWSSPSSNSRETTSLLFSNWSSATRVSPTASSKTTEITPTTVCKPSSLNITVKIDPSKELQYFPINLTCSNWNSSSVDFVISPGPKYADKYFAFASTDQQNVFELQVKSKSTPIDEYPTYLRIEIDGVVLNLLSFDILVTINKIIEIKLLKNPDIEEKLPVGQIVAEFAINSSYQAVDLQVESEDMPDFFTLTTITNNKMFNIEVKSILDLDILRNSGNCCYKHYTEYSRPKECSKLECLSYGVEYNFTVKVTDPKNNLTDTLPVTVFVKDRDDHTLTCETSIKLSRYLRLNVKSISCNDADYGLFKYNTVANTCENEICIDADNGFVHFYVDLIPTKTSCQTVLNVTDGLHSTEVNVTFTFRECPSGSDYKQQVWEIAGPGMTKNGTCPKGYAGNVTRYCTHEGYYEDPIYNCTSIDLMEIFGNLTDDKVELDKNLDKLSDFTSTSGKNNGTLQYRDTATVVNILSVITDKLNVSSNLPEITDKYLQVVDNIIDEKSFSSWNDSIQQTHSGAETVLETLDKFTEKLATGNLTSGIEVPKPNIYLKIAKITKCDNNVEFPDRKSSAKVADWTKHSMDLVKLPCSPQTSSSTFSGVVYRNISQLLNKGISNKSTTQEINAPILSFSLFPSLLDKCKPLDVPIELIFDLYNTSLGSPKCSYWSKPDRKWSTDGCWLVSHNKEDNTVTCKCNHLTNFAILMSPSYTPIGVHHEALSTITLVGCIISMVCLCITVIMFCVFWRHVRSSRTIIHINLCIALFIAYLIFVTGLEATKNKDLCMAVAALLQFFLLVAFFTMLVEGLNLAFIVLKPMSDKKPAVPLLIGAYIIAGTVTGVSIGAHFNDYIREKFCWLSVESGAVWSFIGPVILVIMLNIIIVIIVVYTMFGTASMARRTNKEKTKVALRNIIILTPTLGFAWIIGLFAINEHAIIFQYLFAILNSLQGLLIFIIHLVLNNKIRDVVKSRYSRWLSSRSLSSEKPTRSTIQ